MGAHVLLAEDDPKQAELIRRYVRHEGHDVRVVPDGRDCAPGEFRILQTLGAEPGRVFTREELLEQIHGFDRYITGRTVDVHVKNLRKKIEPDPRDPVRIVTVYGIGYKLTEGS